MGSITLAATSAYRFTRLTLSGRIHVGHALVGKSFRIEEAGTYTVFRQTDSLDGVHDGPVTLVVGFRLKLLRNGRLGHWLFQRLCILTTPFWSGFRGFRVKLWMVDRRTKNYLGIYKWAGAANAERYASTLQRVLNFFSIPGTVWYSIHPVAFETYLAQRATTG